MKKPAKPKRGRPSFADPTKRRVILPRTYVDQSTLDGIRSDGRPAGRTIDDMWQLWDAARKGDDLAIILRAIRK